MNGVKIEDKVVNKNRIYLSSPHIGDLEKVFIEEAFTSNWVAPLGPNVDRFEGEVADYVGIKSSLAVVSGTAAIHLALKLVGVKKGDLVFCSSLTFAASCNPIVYEGAEPVFIDSEPQSYNMSPIALEKAFKYYEAINRKPKAVVVVHIYGQSADMDKLLDICNKYEVPIIEDAAESLGATYKGVQTGTIGKYGIYSFNGNKIITTSGGGMLVGENESAIKKAKFWATQSKENELYYQHSEIGYNYRMSNIVAGIGRGQLRILDERIAKKKYIFETYKKAFEDIEDISMLPICDYGEPNYWLSVMIIKENSKIKPIDIIKELEKENIESRYIWKPMNLQPIFKENKFFKHNSNEENEESVAEKLFNRGVCLPSDTKNTIEDMERIISIIRSLFLK